MKPASIRVSEDERVVTALIGALVITLFLFYIDEGYYNFNWMAYAGNWVPFFFYTGALLGIQLLVSEVILMKCSARIKTRAIPATAATVLVLLLLAFSK